MSYRLRQQVDEIEKLTLHPAVSRVAGYLVAQASSEVPIRVQGQDVVLLDVEGLRACAED